MSVGQVWAMALAAMLSWEMDVNKLDDGQFKLVQDELKVHSIEIETQQDLASVLWDLDLWEGKKIDMASLPKYAWLWGKKKVVTDAGSVEMMGKDEIQAVVEALLTTPKFRYLGWNKPKSIAKKIGKISEDKLAVCVEKYEETIAGGGFSDVEKGQVMVAVLNLYGYDAAPRAKVFITWEHKALQLNDISKKVPNLMARIDWDYEKINQTKQIAKEIQLLRQMKKVLDKEKESLDKEKESLDNVVKYINQFIKYMNGDINLSKRQINEMIEFTDWLLGRINFWKETEKNWKTIKKWVYKKLSK